jgi:hypothetical protein
MALSIGILSRSILKGTHTVLLQRSHRSKDNPRPPIASTVISRGNLGLGTKSATSAMVKPCIGFKQSGQ